MKQATIVSMPSCSIEEVKYEDLLSDHPAIRAEFNILPSQPLPHSPEDMEIGSCGDEKLPEDEIW